MKKHVDITCNITGKSFISEVDGSDYVCPYCLAKFGTTLYDHDHIISEEKQYASMNPLINTMIGLNDNNRSDGSTASYYELPEGCKELQDLISYRNMNSQVGEIFRACFRYGKVSHSDKLRDAKKMVFYATEEVKRLEKYGEV